MVMANFSAIILAAGKATRFKSARPKVLHPLAGRMLGEYAIRAALAAEPEKAYLIVGHEAAQVRSAFEKYGLQFIEQAEQLGTGHALMMAKPELERCESPIVIVLVGDMPLLRAETLLALAATHAQSKNAATILTTHVENPSGYGRIVRGAGGRVRAIVEEKVATAAQKKIKEINSGILCFSRKALLARLDELSPNNAQREYLLTDLIGIMARHGEKTGALLHPDSLEVLGVNDRAELAQVEKLLRLRKAEALMREGVTIVDPESAYIDEDVEIGADSRIEPGVRLAGTTRLGKDCTIEAWSVVTDSLVGDGVRIRQGSLVSGCTIASDVVVGPFAHLRDGAQLEAGARIGNFVEVKKSRIGPNVRALHLTYLGDATLGERANIGAGTVTCNYDGEKKHPTIIERGAFIGSGSMLVAPVRVGEGAYVAAGSAITRDVPAKALAIGRATQVNKEGWVERHAEDKATAPSASKSASPHGEPHATPLAAGEAVILDLPVRVTYGAGADGIRDKLNAAFASGQNRMVVNFKRVTYIDSAGLGALATALISARRAGGDVRLAAVPSNIMRLLETVNLPQKFEVFPDAAEAAASFKESSSA